MRSGHKKGKAAMWKASDTLMRMMDEELKSSNLRDTPEEKKPNAAHGTFVPQRYHRVSSWRQVHAARAAKADSDSRTAIKSS